MFIFCLKFFEYSLRYKVAVNRKIISTIVNITIIWKMYLLVNKYSHSIRLRIINKNKQNCIIPFRQTVCWHIFTIASENFLKILMNNLIKKQTFTVLDSLIIRLLGYHAIIFFYTFHNNFLHNLQNTINVLWVLIKF